MLMPSHKDRELGVHTGERSSESHWLRRGRYGPAKCMLSKNMTAGISVWRCGVSGPAKCYPRI